MSLAARFEQVTSMSFLRVDQMEPERCYTIKLAERVTALLGPTVWMIIEDGGKEHLTHLPRRYARSVNDEDIAMINSARVWWSVMCGGFVIIGRYPRWKLYRK
jgi:hypothetical protein